MIFSNLIVSEWAGFDLWSQGKNLPLWLVNVQDGQTNKQKVPQQTDRIFNFQSIKGWKWKIIGKGEAEVV